MALQTIREVDFLFKIWIYKKALEEEKSIDSIIALLPKGLTDTCMIYTDSERDLISYQKLKDSISGEEGILVFVSLGDISRSPSVVIRELTWLLQQNIMIASLDYPSTFVFSSKEINHAVIRLLLDVLQKEEARHVLDFQNQKALGRRKLAYPDNWDKLYHKWKNKEITARQFMQASGLKKGTFYHLVKDYEMITAHLVEIIHIG